MNDISFVALAGKFSSMLDYVFVVMNILFWRYILAYTLNRNYPISCKESKNINIPRYMTSLHPCFKHYNQNPSYTLISVSYVFLPVTDENKNVAAEPAIPEKIAIRAILFISIDTSDCNV